MAYSGGWAPLITHYKRRGTAILLFTVGMTKKDSQLSLQELQLIEQLRQRPELIGAL
jgi:hypothetical protein